MKPLIIGLITAILFLSFAAASYGAEAIVTDAWIPTVFWWLLGSGFTVYILSEQAEL